VWLSWWKMGSITKNYKNIEIQKRGTGVRGQSISLPVTSQDAHIKRFSQTEVGIAAPGQTDKF